jgi:ketosteroid isomerase-like protein
MKGKTMKHFKLVAVIFLFVVLASSTFAGDKEDVLASLNSTIEAFNKHDIKAYFANFVADNTEFPYVVSPLRHDAAMWKNFIEGTTSLAYVNYHQQDSEVQIYNGNTAIITGYYTFSWMEKGGQMNYQSGRASMVLVKQDGKWMTAHMHFSKMF